MARCTPRHTDTMGAAASPFPVLSKNQATDAEFPVFSTLLLLYVNIIKGSLGHEREALQSLSIWVVCRSWSMGHSPHAVPEGQDQVPFTLGSVVHSLRKEKRGCSFVVGCHPLCCKGLVEITL